VPNSVIGGISFIGNSADVVGGNSLIINPIVPDSNKITGLYVLWNSTKLQDLIVISV
jgi:hypothetical protein